MKKQQQKTLKIGEFDKIVQSSKMTEVAPPQSASKDMLTGKYAMTAKEATSTWFKSAKTQNPSSGFLEVPSEQLKPQAAFEREMMYKGKKKGDK